MKRFRTMWMVLAPLAGRASAHEVHPSGGSGFGEGFLHPVMGVDHLVAMVAVGLWGAVLGGKLKWQLPVIFPLVMALGGVLGVRGVPLPMVEVWIALSGVLIGLAVLCEWKPAPWIAWSLVGLFAVFHGHAHGKELPHAADPLVYGVGFVMATGLLHLAGIAIGELDRWKPHGGRLVRFAGGLIALTGCWYLFRALAG